MFTLQHSFNMISVQLDTVQCTPSTYPAALQIQVEFVQPRQGQRFLI